MDRGTRVRRRCAAGGAAAPGDGLPSPVAAACVPHAISGQRNQLAGQREHVGDVRKSAGQQRSAAGGQAVEQLLQLTGERQPVEVGGAHIVHADSDADQVWGRGGRNGGELVTEHSGHDDAVRGEVRQLARFSGPRGQHVGHARRPPEHRTANRDR